MEAMRSLIFVPGNRRDMLEKARDFDADALMVDLEDSVPEAAKLDARQIVGDVASTLSRRGRRLMVRVNSMDTGYTRDDLAAVIGPHLYGVSVGKVVSASDMEEYQRMISVLEKKADLDSGHVKLIPWIENARAVLGAHEIAVASPRVVALAFGPEDYTDDMGVQRTDMGQEVYLPRALVAIAARAAGVAALDGPYVKYLDEDGLRADVEVALKLGYRGKFAIHPAQLDAINRMFSPLLEDVEYARRVVEAWDQAEAVGRGSTSLDGRMIDVPVVKRARSLLALADAIARRS